MAAFIAGGSKRRSRYQPLAEINVTPLVDVMLVLLIIFMVTAPMMNNAVNLDLPKAAATPVNQDSDPLTVSVDAKGQVFLQDQPIALTDLVTKLAAIAADKKDRRIFVRGDQVNSYGTMLQVMGTIIQGGFTKVSLLTAPGAAGVAPARAGTTAPVVAPPASSTAPTAPRPPGRG